MAERFSLKDHLFNADTIGQLADECAAGLPGFDRGGFFATVMAGLEGRELKARLDWIADCLEPHLSRGFADMADELQAILPPPLDPGLSDDDFGQFIHAVPGVLAVRHGLSEQHLERALDLLEQATQRFSMEFYIRPFLDAFPGPVLERLRIWATHPNYHVRRLVSEGTRPKLPWAGALKIDPLSALPLLTKLHADPTRYVTRSVANHLNDLAKRDPDLVLQTLADWQAAGRQSRAELSWMAGHALRTLVKQGHPRALALLGYSPDAPLEVARFDILPAAPRIGDTIQVEVDLRAPERTPVLVDYVIWFQRPGGSVRPKVHKLKQSVIPADQSLSLGKAHRLKGDATTYALVPGPHRVALQVNGRILAEAVFELRPAAA